MANRIPLLPVSVPERVCVLCEQFNISFGSGGYSEYTPGYPGNAECCKGYWYLEEGDCNAQFREAIKNAEVCADYNAVVHGC